MEIRKTNGELCGYDSNGDLIATMTRLQKPFKEYLICWFGGDIHGSLDYAIDYEDLEKQLLDVSNTNSINRSLNAEQ